MIHDSKQFKPWTNLLKNDSILVYGFLNYGTNQTRLFIFNELNCNQIK